MSSHRKAALAYARDNQEKFLSELNEFVAIPSISTDDDHKEDMRLAAEWVANKLKNLGIQNVQVFPTKRHPVVYGQWLKAVNAPTVLIYGHYDVQPVDPLDLWESDPFGAVQKGENLFSRGASDMKGQVSASLSAIESAMSNGKLPVNVKFIIEGEEEIGSPNLESFIADHKELLACDFALNPDSGMIGKESPTITYALRGLAYFELRIYGPDHDLHSGLYGGVVHNPAVVLAKLIAGMHDDHGRITLPGYYDKVRALSEEERQELSRLPVDEKFYLQQTGVPALWGESGFSPVERVGGRPTLEINGILSGFTGQGSKTVLPAHAMAKISMRLVPDQNPSEVEQQLREYLRRNAPATVRWELDNLTGGLPSISDRNNAGVKAMATALEEVWGRKPFYKREGGSVPVVSQMQRLLGVESVLTGFGLPDDNLHAPNEKLHLPTWYKGIEALIHFFYNLAEK